MFISLNFKFFPSTLLLHSLHYFIPHRSSLFPLNFYFYFLSHSIFFQSPRSHSPSPRPRSPPIFFFSLLLLFPSNLLLPLDIRFIINFRFLFPLCFSVSHSGFNDDGTLSQRAQSASSVLLLLLLLLLPFRPCCSHDVLFSPKLHLPVSRVPISPGCLPPTSSTEYVLCPVSPPASSGGHDGGVTAAWNHPAGDGDAAPRCDAGN